MALDKSELTQLASLLGEVLAPRIREAVAENVAVRMEALSYTLRSEQKEALDGLHDSTAALVSETAAKISEKFSADISNFSSTATKHTDSTFTKLNDALIAFVDGTFTSTVDVVKNEFKSEFDDVRSHFNKELENVRAAIPVLSPPPDLTFVVNGEVSDTWAAAFEIATKRTIKPLIDSAVVPLHLEQETVSGRLVDLVSEREAELRKTLADIDAKATKAVGDANQALYETVDAFEARAAALEGKIAETAKTVPLLVTTVEESVQVSVDALRSNITTVTGVLNKQLEVVLEKQAEIVLNTEARLIAVSSSIDDSSAAFTKTVEQVKDQCSKDLGNAVGSLTDMIKTEVAAVTTTSAVGTNVVAERLLDVEETLHKHVEIAASRNSKHLSDIDRVASDLTDLVKTQVAAVVAEQKTLGSQLALKDDAAARLAGEGELRKHVEDLVSVVQLELGFAKEHIERLDSELNTANADRDALAIEQREAVAAQFAASEDELRKNVENAVGAVRASVESVSERFETLLDRERTERKTLVVDLTQAHEALGKRYDIAHEEDQKSVFNLIAGVQSKLEVGLTEIQGELNSTIEIAAQGARQYAVDLVASANKARTSNDKDVLGIIDSISTGLSKSVDDYKVLAESLAKLQDQTSATIDDLRTGLTMHGDAAMHGLNERFELAVKKLEQQVDEAKTTIASQVKELGVGQSALGENLKNTAVDFERVAADVNSLCAAVADVTKTASTSLQPDSLGIVETRISEMRVVVDKAIENLEELITQKDDAQTLNVKALDQRTKELRNDLSGLVIIESLDAVRIALTVKIDSLNESITAVSKLSLDSFIDIGERFKGIEAAVENESDRVATMGKTFTEVLVEYGQQTETASKELTEKVAELSVKMLAGSTGLTELQKLLEETREFSTARIAALEKDLNACLSHINKSNQEHAALLEHTKQELTEAVDGLTSATSGRFDLANKVIADAVASIASQLKTFESDQAASLIANARAATLEVIPDAVLAQADALIESLRGPLVLAARVEATGVANEAAERALGAARAAAEAIGDDAKAHASEAARLAAESASVLAVERELAKLHEKLHDELYAELDPTERVSHSVGGLLPNEVRAAVQAHIEDVLEPKLTVQLAAKLQAEVDRIPRPRDGRDGESGRAGKDGRDGANARVVAPEPYEVGKRYALGDWVAHRNGVWVAARSTDNEPDADSTDWDCVVPGIKAIETMLGEDGRTLSVHYELTNGEFFKSATKLPIPVPRGVYESAKTYDNYDLVTYDGSQWIAQRAGVLPRPGTDPAWKLQIKHGKDGRDLKQPPPPIIRLAGDWQMDTMYEANQVVMHAGVHWLALRSNRERPPFSTLVSNDTWLKLGA